jgi:hypothetical protein
MGESYSEMFDIGVAVVVVVVEKALAEFAEGVVIYSRVRLSRLPPRFCTNKIYGPLLNLLHLPIKLSI